MCNSVVQQLAPHAEHEDKSAHVHHSHVGDQSCSIARTAHSTNCPKSSAWLIAFSPLLFSLLTFSLSSPLNFLFSVLSLFRSRSLSLFSFFMTNPEVVAEILEETGVLGWIIAALLEDGPNQEVVWSGFFFNSGVSQQNLKCFF